MTAAYYLAKKGHSITVFDALPAAGGMARYGIPSYRVPLDVIDNEVAEVTKLGVEIRYNTRVEKIDELFAQGHEAVFIGIGAQGGDKLGLPGDSLPNVVDSPTFLRAATLGLIGTPETDIVIGKRVAVIGGGNVATDNARSARRLGAEVVDMVYRRTREGNAGARRRGAGLRGGRRQPALPAGAEEDRTERIRQFAPENHLREDGTGCARCFRPPPPGGNPRQRIHRGCRPGHRRHWPVPEEIRGLRRADQRQGPHHRARRLHADLQPGVYAGGDCVLGPSTLIESVAQGRIAAAAIDSQLGETATSRKNCCPTGTPTRTSAATRASTRSSASTRPSSTRPAATTGMKWSSVSTRKPPRRRRCAA
ncbi:MAG: FAD-dependent oxidoreductase [Rhodocyclaceae bacterium]|nr:FAD-dependent oxidoreductase [Rhodocyclaceae bacterium]